jgi:lysophospholipase L1-like esterase
MLKWRIIPAIGLLFLILVFIEMLIRNSPLDQSSNWNITKRSKELYWNIEPFINMFNNHDNKGKETTSGGDTYSVQKDKGTIRIVCLGASSTQGIGVVTEDTYPGQLEKLLVANNKRIKYQVINAGIGGSTSFKLLIYFKDILRKFDPDIVTLYLGCNDATYEASQTDKEFYEYVKNLKERLPSISTNNQLVAFLCVSPRLLNNITGRIFIKLFRSRIFFSFWNFLGCLNNRVIKRRVVKQVPLELGRETLEEFVELAKKDNFRLIFMPEADFYFTDAFKPYIDIMKEVSIQHGIPFVDVRLELYNHRYEHISQDAVHPTALGYEIMAKEIFKKMTYIWPDLLKKNDGSSGAISQSVAE